jgi:transposase
MNALSKDLRTKILEYYQYEYGATYKSTADYFGVGEATVSRLVRHFYETGDVAVTPPKPKSFHRIDLDWLREKTKNGVDKLIRELISEYEIERNIKVAISSMWNALKALGMSHKKNSYSQRKRI